MNPRIESLQKMLNGPRDGALLRFSLGNEFMKENAWQEAAEAFRAAVERDPGYSAAWKGLGKAFTFAFDDLYRVEDIRLSVDNNDSYALAYSIDNQSWAPLFTQKAGQS